jgi:pimeloyl-ACP methyl ester carboxylesterase
MDQSTHLPWGSCALAVLFLLLCSGVSAQTSPAAWQYDLRPGDHLVYRYSLERQVSGTEVFSRSQATFTTHVIVLGLQNGRLAVGFQRNRESARLLEYREKGKDRLDQRLPDFQRRLAAQPSRFAEANELSLTGEPLGFWQAARESPSKILLAVHEIEALPARAVVPGDTWKGSNVLGLDFRFVGIEALNGKQCARVEGRNETASLRYWWCSESGVLGKLEFAGEYPVYGEATVHEKITFELQQRLRGGSIPDWLGSPDTQRAALESLLMSRWIAIPAGDIATQLRSDDVQIQGATLAILYQRGLPFADQRLLAERAQSENPEVKRIATRMLNPSPESTPPASRCGPQGRSHFAAQKPGSSLRLMRSQQFRGAPYVLHIPRDYTGERPFPLLVYLSGGGGLAMDGVNTAEDAVAGQGYLVLYPQAGDLWWKPEITAKFDALFDEVVGDLNVDTNRVYIAGFSNGGTGALYYATLWPQRFAAVVSLMGEGVCLPEIAANLSNTANLPMLLVHGDKDPLISPTCSSETNEALRQLTPPSARELRILKNRGHDVTLQDDDGLSLPFLTDKVRVLFPAKLSLRIPDLSHPRRYWVEVIEKGAGTAEIEAQIEANGTIKLETHNVKRMRLLLRPEMLASIGTIRIIVNRKEMFRGELKQDCEVPPQSSGGQWDPALAATDVKEFTISR